MQASSTMVFQYRACSTCFKIRGCWKLRAGRATPARRGPLLHDAAHALLGSDSAPGGGMRLWFGVLECAFVHFAAALDALRRYRARCRAIELRCGSGEQRWAASFDGWISRTRHHRGAGVVLEASHHVVWYHAPRGLRARWRGGGGGLTLPLDSPCITAGCMYCGAPLQRAAGASH
jgi:hypothetical protein